MCLFLQKAYKQINNYYINQISSECMKRKFVLLLACLLAGVGLAIAQAPKTITGVVISEEDNQPVVGASILVKGTAIGTTTNVDGKFTIAMYQVLLELNHPPIRPHNKYITKSFASD